MLPRQNLCFRYGIWYRYGDIQFFAYFFLFNFENVLYIKIMKHLVCELMFNPKLYGEG